MINGISLSRSQACWQELSNMPSSGGIQRVYEVDMWVSLSESQACWQELAQLLPARQIHLWMVGPEVLPPHSSRKPSTNQAFLNLLGCFNLLG